MTTFEWSTENVKLKKTRKAWERRFGGRTKFVGFSLPQLKSRSGQTTCPFAGACAEVCYASQGSYYMPHVQAKYERNLKQVLDRRGVLTDALVRDLEEIRPTHVRLHDSGDFFSAWYVRAWLRVAEALPQITLYAYTKSIPLVPFAELPANLRVTQSLGGKRDEMVDLGRSHSKIFATGEERRAAGYRNGNLDDMPVLLGVQKIGLVYHGTRTLNDEQLVQLRR